MRNIILGVAILLGTATVAEAQQHQRHRHQNQHRQHHYQPRHHYQPQHSHRHHSHNRRVDPWVYGLGALALGAGTYYYTYRPTCERYIDGYRWNGYDYVPVVKQFCY